MDFKMDKIPGILTTADMASTTRRLTGAMYFYDR
jgi:hypothetical protein